MDPAEYRVDAQRRWERSAPGWIRHRDSASRAAAPVTRRMLEAVELAPGRRVLDLAAGPGELGLQAAERVAPGGQVLVTDFAEGMLAEVRARAAALGLAGVETQVVDAESIPLSTAAFDAALCRWGYMLMADPGAALRETRRVLRPGGRLALAVWDAAEHNAWLAAPARLWVELGLVERPTGGPGPFALADRDRLEELLRDAGFLSTRVQAVDLRWEWPSFEAWIEALPALSDTAAGVLGGLTGRHRAEVEAHLRERLAPWTRPDGAVALPGRSLVAVAEA